MITTGKMISSFNKLSQLIFSRKCIEIVWRSRPVVDRLILKIKNNLKFKHARVIGKLYSYLYYTFTCVNFVSLKRNAVVSPESRFARRRSPGYWSIRPMTYNTLQQGENTFRGVISVTLGFHKCSHCFSMHIPFFQA